MLYKGSMQNDEAKKIKMTMYQVDKAKQLISKHILGTENLKKDSIET